MNPYQPPLGPHHTPPFYPSQNNENGSPTKRPRLSPPPQQGQPQFIHPPLPSAPQQQAVAVPQLKSLPLPLLLLTLAQSYYNLTVPLYSALSKKPHSSNSHKRYLLARLQYVRYSSAAITALRRVVELTSSGGQFEGFGAGRIEIRARGLLVKLIGKTLRAGGGSTTGNRELAEVDKVLSRALIASEKHESLQPYTPHLVLLQPSLTSSSPQSHKYARQTLRRLLSLPSLPPHWIYHLQMRLATLPGTSYADSLNAWSEVEKLATSRGDELIKCICWISVARISLAKGGQWDRVSALLSQIEDLKDPSTGRAIADYLPINLKVLAMLIQSLYQAHMGEIKVAKERLKIAHGLLDRAREEGEEKRSEDEGWCTIPINPPDPRQRINQSDLRVPAYSWGAPLPSVRSITLDLAPRSLVYNFAFLASVAVHRDPFGSKPRSTLFANEGLKLFDLKLSGGEAAPPLVNPERFSEHLAQVARMKIHLLLFSAELEIMRSSLDEAMKQLLDAITTARSYPGLWDEYGERITLDMGMWYHSKGRETQAEECYETVLVRLEEDGEDETQQQRVLAGISLILLKMSQGVRVRSSSTSSNVLAGSTASPQRPSSRHNSSYLSSTRLDALARDLIALTTSSTSSPSSKLLGEFIQALTRGEITRAKQHLSVALQISNTMNSNHAKALCLALLANLFLMTRNDQAQKMLHAASHLAKGMGARPANTAVPTSESKPQEQLSPDDLVGNARLGLWLGERLLEAYKKDNSDPFKITEQERRNDAHRKVLTRQESVN